MNCDYIRPILPDLVAGDIPNSEAAEINAHLLGCYDCRQLREREQDVTQMLRGWSEPGFGDDERTELRLKIRAAIEAESRRVVWPASALRFAAAASIALCAVLLGLVAYDGSGSPSGESAMAGPATRVEESEPGVFTMVGPFSEKEKVERGGRRDRMRRVEHKPRPAGRRVVKSDTAPAATTDHAGTGDSDSMMRFEFQTQDPKIRIIWFVPRADEPVSASSQVGD